MTTLRGLKAIARRVGVTPLTIHRWGQAGLLPLRRLGGGVMIEDVDLMAALDRMAAVNIAAMPSRQGKRGRPGRQEIAAAMTGEVHCG